MISLHLKNSSDATYPYIELKNEHNGANSSEIRFLKQSSSADAGDDLGIIKFKGYSNGTTTLSDFCQIIGDAKTTTSASEEGQLLFKVKSGGSELDSLTINPTGVGIGTNNPQGNLHISSGTSGDCVLILESDTDNNNEADNPRIELKQDNGESIFHIGLNGETSSGLYTSPLQNAAYFLSDNPIQFVTGGTHTTPSDGTARLTILDNGNVGIGTNNPTTQLDIIGGLTEANSNISLDLPGNNIIRSQWGDSASGKNWNNHGQHKSQLRIQTPVGKTTINSVDYFRTLELGISDLGRGIIQANHSGTGYQVIHLNPAAGGVAINDSNISQYPYDANYKFYVNGAAISSTWNTTSDDRFKFNEANINGSTALTVVNQLQPKKYEKISSTPIGASGSWLPTDQEWDNVKGNYEWKNEAGFIAQEIQNISELSFSVIGQEVDSDGNQTPLTLNYDNIYAYHIAATKELSSQLDAEKAKTATLETQVADLLARVTALENP